MKNISDSQIFKSMEICNPWWNTERIEKEYSKMTPRFYLPKFLADITDKKLKRTILLLGPRRIGKTVLMSHSIQELLKSGVKPKNILYISIDNIIFTNRSLQDFVNIFMENFNHKISDTLYIYFDEIQYLKDWERHLKSLYDLYINFHFIASGSAASVIQKKSSSGVGRFHNFVLPPIGFFEFIFLKDKVFSKKVFNFITNKNGIKETKEGISMKIPYRYLFQNLKKLNKLFLEYVSYGGFPDVLFLNKKEREEKRSKISSDIIEKVLSSDLPILYNVDPREINRFFKMVAYNTGQEFSYKELHQQSGIAKSTIKDYINYLESAFLVKKISKVDQTSKKFEKETHFKLYLYNPSIRTFLFGEVDENDTNTLGHLVENAVFTQYLQSEETTKDLYYARWNGGEVDLIILDELTQKPKHICEIKWTDKYAKSPSDLKSLKKYVEKSKYYKKINKNEAELPTVTTKTIMEEDLYHNISFVPTSIYCIVKSMEVWFSMFCSSSLQLFINGVWGK